MRTKAATPHPSGDEHLLKTASGSDDKNNSGDGSKTVSYNFQYFCSGPPAPKPECAYCKKERDQERRDRIAHKVDRLLYRAGRFSEFNDRSTKHKDGRQKDCHQNGR
jgi:hypothetical protein